MINFKGIQDNSISHSSTRTLDNSGNNYSEINTQVRLVEKNSCQLYLNFFKIKN